MLAPLAGLALVLLASACGGASGAAKQEGRALFAGALVAPASAPLILSVDADFESGQVETLRSLIDKFPAKEKLYGALTRALSKQKLDLERDVRPALGPEVNVVLLDFANGGDDAVVLTQPADPAKLDALLEKSDVEYVKEEVAGWTVVAEKKELIDRFKQARSGGSLASTGTFKDATADLPGEALAKLYVNGARVMDALRGRGADSIPGLGALEWVSGDALAREDGVAVDLHAKADKIEAASYTPELASQIPSGVLAYLSFKNLQRPLDELLSLPEVEKQLGKLKAAAGVPLGDLTSLLAGEGAVYLRGGALIPEITAVLQVADEAGALATADRLAGSIADALGKRVEPSEAGGVPAKKIDLGPVSVYYAAVGGKLVISDSPGAITGLRSARDRLAENPAFREAKDAAGMPDETAGFLFVNLEEVLPLIESLAQLAEQKLPPAVGENVAPLRSLIVYGTVDGGTLSLRGFLQIE